MGLDRGTRLGAYEILTLIGVGGMGEVYRAHDTKLGRDVALKILPPSFTNDPDRVARFRREAQVLASLNHAHIAQIYGFEELPNPESRVPTHVLVLEFVDGESLDARLARGRLSVDEALEIAKQIAEALETAHEKGIVHRDLKPANVALTKKGQVKVLDFGLAKAVETPTGSVEATNSPTITSPAMLTGIGVILGTAAYMAPEQAKGRAADKRSDIWAFGCVLYEMLAGKRAFAAAADVSDTIVSILKDEPDWGALPADTPLAVLQALRLCLQKDQKRRLGDISDVALAMDGAFAPPLTPAAASPLAAEVRRRSSATAWKAAVAVLAASTLAVAFIAYRALATSPPVMRFDVAPPDETTFVTAQRTATSVAISPDGRTLAFTARDATGKTLLWVRALESLTAQPLPGTDEAAFPFWSPDGRFIAYLASGNVVKVAATGGPPQILCALNSPLGRGGAWGGDGVIVFQGGAGTGLSRVSSTGGQSASFQKDGSFPSFLPDGRHVLFFREAAGGTAGGTYVASLDGGAPTQIVASDSAAVYDARHGYLLFARQGTLLAQRFNPKTLTLGDEPMPIAEGVESSVLSGVVSFSVSQTGVLAYGRGLGSSTSLQMVWVDRQGKAGGTVGPSANYRGIDLSPDGTRIAAHRHDGSGGDVWLTDASRDTTSRLTFDASQDNSSPIWSPDGQRIAFGSIRNGKWGIYTKPSNGAGREERLIESAAQVLPMAWAPDGRSIVYQTSPTNDPNTSGDLWLLPLIGPRTPSALVRMPSGETHGQISPDGKWIAYMSIATGRMQVYVQPFPSGDGQWQVSTTGGAFPRWRRDGRELFYMSSNSGGRIVAVPIDGHGSTLDIGTPKELFDSGYVNLPSGGRYHPYVVSRDGQRFLIPRPESAGPAWRGAPIVVVLNWVDGIRK